MKMEKILASWNLGLRELLISTQPGRAECYGAPAAIREYAR
jgi:hypothetical protein